MKLITYSNDNSTSCGILTGDFIIDIPSAWPAPNPPRSVKEILGRGRSCLVKLAELLVSAEAEPEREPTQSKLKYRSIQSNSLPLFQSRAKSSHLQETTASTLPKRAWHLACPTLLRRHIASSLRGTQRRGNLIILTTIDYSLTTDSLLLPPASASLDASRGGGVVRTLF